MTLTTKEKLPSGPIMKVIDRGDMKLTHQIMIVTEGLLVSSDQKDTDVIRVAIKRMQGERITIPKIPNKAINLAIGIASNIAENTIDRGAFI